MDLKFPHHECEIAQGCAATGKKPVKYWMHANMLTLNGKKMSKSTGNTLLPKELFTGQNDIMDKGFHPMVVRFFMMQAHYRSVLDFSSEALIAAEKGFKKLMAALKELPNLKTSNKSSENVAELINKFYAAMNDDFNTPVLIANLFEAVKFINNVKDGKATISQNDLHQLSDKMTAMVFDVLGLKFIDESDLSILEPLMEIIIELRKQARLNKDWTTSDFIRDKVAEAGIKIKDTRDGTSWSF
jgi:cysteinyl-tRNA synthetase